MEYKIMPLYKKELSEFAEKCELDLNDVPTKVRVSGAP
jgi:hypothetical protein